MYNTINAISIVATPLAPAVVWGARVYDAMTTHHHAAPPLAMLSAIAAGIALESVGAGAGYAFVRLNQQGKRKESLLALFLLGSYALMGVWELGVSDALGKLFVVALLAYLVSALQHTANNGEKSAELAREIELAREAEERTLNHAIIIAKEQNRHKLALERARIAAGMPPATPSLPNETAETFTKLSPATSPRTSWRNLSAEEKANTAPLSVPEIEAMYNISTRTAQNWKRWAREQSITSAD